MLKTKIILATCLALISTPALAQDLGHEYEFDAAPIREGEMPVIPLDTNDPVFRAQCGRGQNRLG